MNTSAWQKRDYQRQKFLENLHHQILDAVEERCGDVLSRYGSILTVADSVLHILRQEESTIRGVEERVQDSLAVKATNQLAEFSRTPEERLILEIRLLEKLLESGFGRMKGGFLRQEVHEQERLYGGHKGMDEVEL